MDIRKINNLNLNIDTSNRNKPKLEGNSFQDFYKNALYSVSDLEKKSDEMDKKFRVGEVENIQDVFIATQKADIAIQAFTEVNSKILDAYREIMRIQI